MIDIGRIELPPAETALFLDIDGTLLDLAPRPDEVVVPPSLRNDLASAYRQLDGALALISGRAVDEIDRLFSPLGLPASGVHGSEFRPVPLGETTRLAPRIPESLRERAKAIVARFPGALFEDKGIAIALHWRLAPQFGAAIESEVAAMMETAPAGLAALRGHSVVEIKGTSLNKGCAVERFLERAPFRGRRPVFVGDDVTDEAAFAAVNNLGGFAFAVGRAMEGTLDWFASPAEVRAWLRAGRGGQWSDAGGRVKAPQALDLALIGNCRMGALVDRQARIVWCCFPRFDGDPVFSRLLSGDVDKGFTDVVLAGQVESRADYARNTPVLETVLTDANGGAVRIVDFMPRFMKFERTFRPPQLIRRIEPIAGLPRVKIRVRPTFDYGRDPTTTVIGSNHIRYVGTTEVLRLSTDAPLSYISNETTFALTRPMTLIFGSDEPFVTEIESTALDFENRTRHYWLGWVRSLGIPFEWQDETIRAAITLKLCSFDETGAIIAAHTTSIPEAPNTSRNWDYRFCWIRDAYYVVNALNRLGATQTMENFLNYLTTVVTEDTSSLQPLHAIIPGLPLEELHADYLDGFLGHGPVRIGNAASVQAQHDGYGSVILACKQLFVDKRLPKMGDVALFRMLEPLGERARALALKPDAGIWEYRGREQVHTYSAAFCWAACDRLAQIAGILGLADRRAYWSDCAASLKETILAQAWNEARGAFVGAFGYEMLDASVLTIADLGLVSADDPRFVKTCQAVGRELERNGRIMRYTAADDFGAPETAFLVCNFWYIDALAGMGRREEAREMFDELLTHRNAFGLLSEDLRTEDNTLWGNIPQTYSMAGIINSATRLSMRWEDAWCRASS